MKNKMTKNKFNIHILIYGLVIFAICSMTIGFAYFNKLLDISGTLTIPHWGKLVINQVSLISSSNVDTSYQPSWTEDSINFNTYFTNSDSSLDCYATYEVTFENTGSLDYVLDNFNFQSIELVSNIEGDTATVDTSITGPVDSGYIFSPGETAVATVTLRVINATEGATYTVDGDVTAESAVEKTYSLEAGILPPKTGDLTGNNTRTMFTLSVVSTYETNVNFTISLSSNNYRVVDSNGNLLGDQTINANSENTYPFYIEIVDPTKISTSQQNLGIIVSANGKSKVVDNVILDVDEYEEFVDEDAPVISSVSFTQSNNYDNRGKGTLTWVGSDDSTITSYTIIVYKNNAYSTTITGVNANSYSFTNLEEDASYYFIVYGTDEYGNTADSNDINNPSLTSGVCVKSATTKCEWVFTVTTNLTGVSSNGASTANLGKTYSCTFSKNSNYSLPSSITVKMNNVTVSSSNYSYSSSSGSFSISNVTGPLDITVTGSRNSCLVEGTKVRLFDGTTKNIEDIKYDDLLAVWNYDTGKIIPDYPIWIEKEQVASSYILIEFDDNTELKIVKDHAVFNINLNEFVSMVDKEQFNIGTEVVKIDKSGNIYTVKVKSIKEIEETVKYYHIMSTKYFNIIANDFLTTDDSVILSNIFGFDENVTWPESRYKIIAKKNNLFDYKDFQDIMPYSLFIGCRALEAKVICDNGYMTVNEFVKYVEENVVNPDMHLEPIKNEKGNNLWMMTTSEDNLNGKENYLFEEGSTYRLPKLKMKDGKKPYWYNGVTNTYYKGGTKIKVDYSMHFELIYK